MGNGASGPVGSQTASHAGSPPRAPFNIQTEGGQAAWGCPHRASDGTNLGSKIVGVIGGFGYRVFDNMSFVGEVLVEWLELDKPRYYHEIKEMKRRRRKEAKRREQQESAEIAAEIAGIEEAEAEAADDKQSPAKA